MDLKTSLFRINKSEQPFYLEFLLRYKAGAKRIYGFVEGVQDPSFYASWIQNALGHDWGFNITAVGGKERVLKLHNEFDWSRFDKRQVLFFVDRDLSDFLDVHVSDTNIYTTDYYSIENHIVTPDILKIIIRDFSKDHGLSDDTKNSIYDKFLKQLQVFQYWMTDTMACMVHWRRMGKLNQQGKQPCFSEIKLDSIFAMENDSCKLKLRDTTSKNFVPYLHSHCGIDMTENDKLTIAKIQKELARNIERNLIRGKFLVWFMCEFLKKIQIPSKKGNLRGLRLTVEFRQENLLVVLGSRVTMPESLRNFLSRNCLAYITDFSATAC